MGGTAQQAREWRVDPVGRIRSELKSVVEAPRQGNEGAPDAWIEIDKTFATALAGLGCGDDLFIFTWLHQARRDLLLVHPRNDATRPLRGVFAARSQDRPNPIGLHRVTLRSREGLRLLVGPIEAIDRTPVLDIKPVLPADRAAAGII